MEVLIVHPTNKKQLSTLKALFEEMKIPFEKAADKGSPYNPEFVKKIKESEKEIAEGNYTTYTVEEFTELCK